MAALIEAELQPEDEAFYETPPKLFKSELNETNMPETEDSSYTKNSHNLNDILQQHLDNNTSDGSLSALETFNKLCMSIATGNFPRPLDMANPAKSWWRYYEKQPATNTAMCYTCGVTFNRGPKQSTTSLSHHLKMYHQEHYIAIQQAKDEDMRMNPRAAKSTRSMEEKILQVAAQELEETSTMKKANFNMNLINAVKLFPELYDPKQRSSGEGEDRNKVWEVVAKTVGDDVPPELAKKRWLQIRDRYRKELKFAIRDQFAYTPKWPYFNQLTWLDEFLKDACSTPIPRRNVNNRIKVPSVQVSSSENEDLLAVNLMGEQTDSSRLFLSNLLASCHASIGSPEAKYEHSPDSAIASTSDQHETHEVENSNENDMHSPASSNQGSSFLENIGRLFQFGAMQNSVQHEILVNEKQPNNSSNPFEWMNDEDMLFGRIIGLRFKNLTHQNKRAMRIAIEKLFEDFENKQKSSNNKSIESGEN
uniref:MADF domain-containing protein n=1 Tax=Acrobeloides nanus TaxID=290746 RepID=A0A914D0K8_9BILA